MPYCCYYCCYHHHHHHHRILLVFLLTLLCTYCIHPTYHDIPSATLPCTTGTNRGQLYLSWLFFQRPPRLRQLHMQLHPSCLNPVSRFQGTAFCLPNSIHLLLSLKGQKACSIPSPFSEIGPPTKIYVMIIPVHNSGFPSPNFLKVQPFNSISINLSKSTRHEILPSHALLTVSPVLYQSNLS